MIGMRWGIGLEWMIFIDGLLDLVIDNFDDGEFDFLDEWLELGWVKII
jgi:hypothetical protein